MSSSLFGTIEQWYIRKHIKEREANGTLHKAPLDSAKASGDGRPQGPGKLTLLERFRGRLGRLQKMAEEAQKAQSTSRGKRRR